ncbi:MAG: Lrp/AsnC family transcriptional regulator [Candidatus Diapherotrites archaeon]|nr:Lrp/AsnC family transcriptional regulator [Candidatus Diapherotrites archaeon]
MNMRMDEANKRILKALIGNSRISSRDLAKEVGYSHQTVLSRLKKLEGDGVIQGYTSRVNWKRLGRPVKVITMVETGNTSPEDLQRVEAIVQGDETIVMSGLMSGEFDMFFFQCFKDEDEAAERNIELRGKLSKIFNIHKFRTHTLWNIMKGDLMPHPDIVK